MTAIDVYKHRLTITIAKETTPRRYSSLLLVLFLDKKVNSFGTKFRATPQMNRMTSIPAHSALTNAFDTPPTVTDPVDNAGGIEKTRPIITPWQVKYPTITLP